MFEPPFTPVDQVRLPHLASTADSCLNWVCSHRRDLHHLMAFDRRDGALYVTVKYFEVKAEIAVTVTR